MNYFYRKSFQIYQWRTQAIRETCILVWSSKLWHPKVSFFQLHFMKKYVDVAINDFTKHLIISKWLRKTKLQTEGKNKKKKRPTEKRNCLKKCFHSFKYIIDPTIVHFFFFNSLWTWSYSLNDVNSLHFFKRFFLY